MKKIPESIRKMPKVELHQHVDGSIPPAVTWRIMKRYELNPVETLADGPTTPTMLPDRLSGFWCISAMLTS